MVAITYHNHRCENTLSTCPIWTPGSPADRESHNLQSLQESVQCFLRIDD